MTELPINSSRVSMTEADHVTPACHVSRRKWGGKWPHCEYFLLSLPTRAGGAATLRITPTQYININIKHFLNLYKKCPPEGGGLLSVCDPIKIYIRDNKGLAATRGIHFSYFLFTLRLQPRQWRIVLPLSSPCQEE